MCIGSGVTLLLDPTADQYLLEANFGDFSDTVALCVTADAENGLSLERIVTVAIGYSTGTAGVCIALLHVLRKVEV